MVVVKKNHGIERKLLRVACHLSFDSKMREKGPHLVGTCGFRVLSSHEVNIALDPLHVGLFCLDAVTT